MALGGEDLAVRPIVLEELRRERDELCASKRRFVDQTRRLALINDVAKAICSNLDLDTIVQNVTDAATGLTGGKFGAFFHNTTVDEYGERYVLYALSGTSRETFEESGFSRCLALLARTLEGRETLRSDNVLRDSRFEQKPLFFKTPQGLKPLVSYLAAPVILRSGDVVGGLFFGHDTEGAFTEDVEKIAAYIAAHAAIAIDAAWSHEASRTELAERRRAHMEAQRLAAVVESSQDAIITKDVNGVITSWNGGAERLFGYAVEEVVGEPMTLLIPPGHHDEGPEIMRRIRRGERIDPYETIRQRKDGSLVEISLSVSPLRSEEGDVVGASAIARDFSELRKVQKQQALLIEEMKHRVKNTLATVQSVAGQTFHGAPPEQRATFNARLHALAKAHDLLGRQTWSHAKIRNVAAQALEPFQDARGERVELDGPDLSIEARKALALAMALHELATNAAKYGALSGQSGAVRVDWKVGGRSDQFYMCAQLTWREEGGPAVKPPARKGFGTYLIERIMDGFGETALSFDPDGVVCKINIAL